MPLHLLFPFASSMLLVVGLILIKRAGNHGVSPWTATFLANMAGLVAFSTLWPLGGSFPGWTLLWQPFVIALFYIAGQACTFCTIKHGDVSVATPIFGVKVVIVPVMLWLLTDAALTPAVWVAAVLGTLGIGLVQQPGPATSRIAARVPLTVVLALLTACSFASFDVCVQAFAPAWGAGRLLPIVFVMVAGLSLGFVPLVQWHLLRPGPGARLVACGAILIALQALSIVYALGTYGDAARINVVYALRVLWGVVIAWWVARRWGGPEAEIPVRVMRTRLAGACLLTVAVALVFLPST